MDIGHQSVPRLVKGQKKGYEGKRKSRDNNDSLKVVYISSPMKVKTSASRFRSLVQHLTGKNSDISRYMEADTGHIASDFHEIGCDENENDGVLAKEVSEQQVLSSISSEDTSASSDSFLWPMNNAFCSQMEEQFAAGIFPSNSFCEPNSQLDVLGSYEELL